MIFSVSRSGGSSFCEILYFFIGFVGICFIVLGFDFCLWRVFLSKLVDIVFVLYFVFRELRLGERVAAVLESRFFGWVFLVWWG